MLLQRRHRTSHPPSPRLNPRWIAWATVLRMAALQTVMVEPLAPLAIMTRWRGCCGLWRCLPGLWPSSEGYAHRRRIHAVSFMPHALALLCISRFSLRGRRSWMRASADEVWEVLGPGLDFIQVSIYALMNSAATWGTIALP